MAYGLRLSWIAPSWTKVENSSRTSQVISKGKKDNQVLKGGDPREAGEPAICHTPQVLPRLRPPLINIVKRRGAGGVSRSSALLTTDAPTTNLLASDPQLDCCKGRKNELQVTIRKYVAKHVGSLLWQLKSNFGCSSFTVTLTTMGNMSYDNPLIKPPLKTVTGTGNDPKVNSLAAQRTPRKYIVEVEDAEP